ECLELVAEATQPRQSLIKVKEARLIHIQFLKTPKGTKSPTRLQSHRFLEPSRCLSSDRLAGGSKAAKQAEPPLTRRRRMRQPGSVPSSASNRSVFGLYFGQKEHPMKLSERVKPISYLKAHAPEIIRGLADGHEPVVITLHGEAKA